MTTDYLLGKKYRLNDFEVLFPIKHGRNAETYRVKNSKGELHFLKLFIPSRLHHSAFDEEKNLTEIELIKKINHPNIISYKDSGEIVIENRKYFFLVTDFISGETLSDRLARGPFSDYSEIRRIATDLLNGLQYLHDLPEIIIHNEITLLNVMLDMSSEPSKARIIDFGYARSFLQSTKSFNKEGLDPFFMASECFDNIFSPQSDIFSVGTVIYSMLYGIPPWFKNLRNMWDDESVTEETILNERRKPLMFPDVSEEYLSYDEEINNILRKALHQDAEKRFKSAKEFIDALNGQIKVDLPGEKVSNFTGRRGEKTSGINIPKGAGFAAIAGMQELKEQLKLDVIDALNNPEEYEKYGITIPNGMLLYGPPGCGKTFFAKHFAEEVGFNFISVTPSDLKSKYVNETQEKIARLFKDAEKNAPSIIFIDEINELLPHRDSDVHEMYISAVNEMLAQMDRTGEKRIFVIGATNYPDLIDPAMLRAGRLDKKFYIPPPDFEARRALFEMYLKKRPLDFGIDYENLASLTENFVSADIDFIANEVARAALKEKSKITMRLLESVITAYKPSVSKDILDKFDAIRAKFSNDKNSGDNNKIKFGFN